METYVQKINHEQAETHVDWSGWCEFERSQSSCSLFFPFQGGTVNCLPTFGIIIFKTLEKLAKSWLSPTKQTVQAADANNINIHELKCINNLHNMCLRTLTPHVHELTPSSGRGGGGVT